MTVLVDTNVFLDVLLERKGLCGESEEVLNWCESNPSDAWIAWHTLANLYYIGAKSVGQAKALRQIDAILGVFEVCPSDSKTARIARVLPLVDFEDALQVAAAQSAGVDWIITRNNKDFRKSPIPALSPTEFLRLLL